MFPWEVYTRHISCSTRLPSGFGWRCFFMANEQSKVLDSTVIWASMRGSPPSKSISNRLVWICFSSSLNSVICSWCCWSFSNAVHILGGWAYGSTTDSLKIARHYDDTFFRSVLGEVVVADMIWTPIWLMLSSWPSSVPCSLSRAVASSIKPITERWWVLNSASKVSNLAAQPWAILEVSGCPADASNSVSLIFNLVREV